MTSHVNMFFIILNVNYFNHDIYYIYVNVMHMHKIDINVNIRNRPGRDHLVHLFVHTWGLVNQHSHVLPRTKNKEQRSKSKSTTLPPPVSPIPPLTSTPFCDIILLYDTIGKKERKEVITWLTQTRRDQTSWPES